MIILLSYAIISAMKRLLIIALFALLTLPVYSCGKEEAKPAPKLKPAKKSTKIVKDYIKTLAEAPGKARDAGAIVEAQQNTTEEMLKQLDE